MHTTQPCSLIYLPTQLFLVVKNCHFFSLFFPLSSLFLSSLLFSPLLPIYNVQLYELSQHEAPGKRASATTTTNSTFLLLLPNTNIPNTTSTTTSNASKHLSKAYHIRLGRSKHIVLSSRCERRMRSKTTR